MMPLRPTTQAVLAEVTDQLRRVPDVLGQLRAFSEVHQVKHGLLGPASSSQIAEEAPDAPDAETPDRDLIPMLTGDEYERSEFSETAPGDVRVRAVRRGGPEVEGAAPGADITLQTDPPRLLSLSALPPELPGLMGWFIASTENEMRFEYREGVPLLQSMYTRVRSRGIGVLRLDQEVRLAAHYAPRDAAAP